MYYYKYVTYYILSFIWWPFWSYILGNFYNVYFSFLIDCKPVYNSKWNNCLIISKNSFLKFTTPALEKYDKIININNYTKWESINFNDFQNIKNIIDENKKKYNTILIRLEKICKIHPDVLYYWYKQNYINKDLYSLKAMPLLKNMYYYDNNNEEINAFAIHMRRGDLLKWCYDIGFTIEYYKEIINLINKKKDIPINIYTESIDKNTIIKFKRENNIDYNDIDVLKNLKNVTIHKGTTEDFSSHFNQLSRSKYLMLSPSGFSLWSAFLSKGSVFIDKKCIKERPNLFKYAEIIPKFLVFDDFKNVLL